MGLSHIVRSRNSLHSEGWSWPVYGMSPCVWYQVSVVYYPRMHLRKSLSCYRFSQERSREKYCKDYCIKPSPFLTFESISKQMSLGKLLHVFRSLKNCWICVRCLFGFGLLWCFVGILQGINDITPALYCTGSEVKTRAKV